MDSMQSKGLKSDIWNRKIMLHAWEWWWGGLKRGPPWEDRDRSRCMLRMMAGDIPRIRHTMSSTTKGILLLSNIVLPLLLCYR